MTSIFDKLRIKRVAVSENSSVQLAMGKNFKLEVANVSLNGVGATDEKGSVKDDDIGKVFENVKLHFDGNEISIGKLMLVSLRKIKSTNSLGFMCIDKKIPVTGKLAKHLVKTDTQNVYQLELNHNEFGLASFQNSTPESTDLFSKCYEFKFMYRDWQKDTRYLYNTVRKPSKGNRINLTKKRKNRSRSDYLAFASNDYLGLASHPALIETVHQTIKEYGFGSTGSAVSTGITKIHEELCDFIKNLYGKESCILFNSGYAVNVGIIPALTTKNDVIIMDRLVHASIIDGVRMSNSDSYFFKHNDMQNLEQILMTNRHNYNGSLVITEGVFSMNGDLPPYAEAVALAKKYNSKILIDEAHSFGLIGDSYLGTCDKFNCIDETDLIMGTFSKICGGIGGFLVGEESVIDWAKNFAKSYIFSVSIPPSTAAAALCAMKIAFFESDLILQLKANIRHFVKGLIQMGADLDSNHESAVIPLVVGDEKKLSVATGVLMESGIYCIPVVYPVVSRKRAGFRFTIMATHSTSDLDFALEVIGKAMNKADVNLFEVKGRNCQQESPGLSRKVDKKAS